MFLELGIKIKFASYILPSQKSMGLYMVYGQSNMPQKRIRQSI